MNGGRVRVTKNHTYIIMGIHAGFDSMNDARAPMPTLLRNASGLSRFGPVGLFPEYGPRAVFVFYVPFTLSPREPPLMPGTRA
jgi:hypothetical protein